jgi:elongation factor G
VENILFSTGAIERLGNVDQGTSVSDFEVEETERGLSVSPSLCHAEFGGVKLNLIDTPGYAEFFGEVVPCIWVADLQLLTVDGQAGVEVHTRKVFATAKDLGTAVVAAVSKLEKEHTDYAAAIESIRKSLDCEAVAVAIPIGAQASFSGVIDLLSMKAYIGGGKGVSATDIPADMAEAAQSAREKLVEAVAASDDALMEKFFEEEALTDQELLDGLKAAVAGRKIVPVLPISGAMGIGVAALLQFIAGVGPAPDARGPWYGEAADGADAPSRKCDAAEPFSAVVFKTLSDPYVGKLSLIRVISGVAQADAQVTNGRTGDRERLAGLSVWQGKSGKGIDTPAPGGLGCVQKLEGAKTRDTLCDQKAKIAFPAPKIPHGMYSLALVAASRADEDKLPTALSRLGEEDIGFQFERNPETNELLATGMGPLHVDIVMQKAKRKFDVAVALSEPRIPYRETVRKSLDRVQGRHKKQTGGRGQFGDVYIKIAPKERTTGNEFANEVSGGSVPTNYIPAVEKGIMDGLKAGPLAGYPVVDVKVTLFDGSSHPVDSSDMAFRLAGQIAIRTAMDMADPVLLEPICNVEVTTPEEIMGDVISDLVSKRGRPQGQEQIGGGLVLINATVPLAEMARYAADLRSLSQGRASYTMEFSHYEDVPGHLTEQIVAAAAKAKEEAG